MTSEQLIYDQLAQHFGYSTFKPGQLAVIQSVLAGQETLAVFTNRDWEVAVLSITGLYLGAYDCDCLATNRINARSGRPIELPRGKASCRH